MTSLASGVFDLDNEAALLKLGKRLATTFPKDAMVYLEGGLGAGKTTLARGILRGLGYGGSVKSPTYTLIEPYEIGDWQVYHCDFYRVNDPLELEFVGIPELFAGVGLKLVEWPERVAGMIPPPDWRIRLEVLNNGRRITIQST